jgi:hypothetical protein
VRNIVFGILALGLGVFIFFSRPPSSTDWINGTWSIQTETNDSKIEKFTFNSNGTMVFGNSSGVIYDDCTYSFYTRSTIDFECNINGKKAIFPLELSNGNSTITMTDGNTYTKSI